MISLKYSLLITLFFFGTLNIFCQENECIVTTINHDFEEPSNTGIYPLFVNDTNVPGWSTTASDSQMEFWSDPNYQNIPAYSGTQFVELNANVVSGLYQDYDSPEGTEFNYGFAHRGRMGTDTCQLLAGPVGGPYVNVGTPVSTGNTAWSYNTGTYVVPANQPTTRFIFQAVSSVGGASVGNFLDNINFTANVGIITQGPLGIFCGEDASLESLGGGNWIESPDNPSTTIISDLNSNDITISGFSVAGEYVFEWNSVYCSSTIMILYDEGFVEEPLVEDHVFCQYGTANPLVFEPLIDHTINWYSDSAGMNSLSQAPTIDTNVVGETTYYVSQENNNGCESDLIPLTITIFATPNANAPTNITLCDDSSNDGLSIFDLNAAGLDALGTQDPANFLITYHFSQADAELNVNNIEAPESYQNSVESFETIYVRIENIENTTCYSTTSFLITVYPFESPNFTYAPNCYGAVVSSLDTPSGIFSFSDIPSDGAEIDGVTGDLTNGTPGESYSVAYETNGNCSNSLVVSVELNALPVIIPPTALEVCDDGIPDGITSIDLTLKNAEVTGNNPNYSVSYHIDQTDADDNANPLPIPYTNTVNGQIVFVRVQDINTGCYDITTLELMVQQAPSANTPTPFEYCDPDSDGFGIFDLASNDNEITSGDPSLTVSYHETMSDADNNVNPLSSPYYNIVVNQQIIYVRVESLTIATDCATIVELILIVNPTPQLGTGPTAYEICDDLSADGFGQFNLTTKDPEILQNVEDPELYIVSYHENEENAASGTDTITNSTNYTNISAFSQMLWVRVEDISTGCYKLTNLELIVNALPVLVQPTPLELCDDNNSGNEMESFNLEDSTEEILNGQTGIILTYFESQADADNNNSPITSPYTNLVNPQTIYIRAKNEVTECVSTVTLLLRVNPIPSPTTPTDLEECDDDNDGFASFDLDSKSLEIIGGELDTAVTYHETQSDAETGENALSSPYTNIVPELETIYIRLTNTITGCYNATETLTLRVLESPEVPIEIEDYIICDSNSDGTAEFDLTTKDAEIIGTQTDVDLTYHISASDALSGNDPIANVSNFTNTINPQIIYVRLISGTNGCKDTGMFNLRVELPPIAIQPTPLQLCDDDVADEITIFDLTVKNNEITGGEGSWSVSYYETDADAQSQENAVDAEAYTNNSVDGASANPQTLYAVITSTDTGCTDQVTLTIRVLPNPTPTEVLPDLVLCDDIDTGDLVEEFDLTTNEILLLNGETGVSPTYYETYEEAESDMDAIAEPSIYNNTSTPQVIYVRVSNDITGCFTIVNFTIIVNPLPEAVAVTDLLACELNTDGIYNFNLAMKDAEVLNGQDPELFTVTYHTSQEDADDLMNALVSPYQNVINPQPIYVAITNNDTSCSISTAIFNVEVQEAAEANSNMVAILFEICDDEMDNDNDSSNNSSQFDLTPVTDVADLIAGSVQAQVLVGQDPENYIVTYYATEADAELGENAIPFLYENIVNPQEIWARVDNDTPNIDGLDSSICYAVAPLMLRVNSLPFIDLDESYTLCVDTNGSQVINAPILETNLSTPTYSFVWLFNGTEIEGAVEGSYMPNAIGTYSVIVTDVTTSLVTMCDNSDSTEVIESAPPIVTGSVTSEAFADTNVIEVTADGIGNYEYSLDHGPWQDENVFSDVSFGEHIVSARDKNGCGVSSDGVLVLDYPRFFTPNGDGFHDTWNIGTMEDQSRAKIYIFDRFGKLLKQISPGGAGWNGTYNGNLMPTSDYWFSVEYFEPRDATNTTKIFKAHFTLKR